MALSNLSSSHFHYTRLCNSVVGTPVARYCLTRVVRDVVRPVYTLYIIRRDRVVAKGVSERCIWEISVLHDEELTILSNKINSSMRTSFYLRKISHRLRYFWRRFNVRVLHVHGITRSTSVRASMTRTYTYISRDFFRFLFRSDVLLVINKLLFVFGKIRIAKIHANRLVCKQFNDSHRTEVFSHF